MYCEEKLHIKERTLVCMITTLHYTRNGFVQLYQRKSIKALVWCAHPVPDSSLEIQQTSDPLTSCLTLNYYCM